jgi:SAM-dependent methyltransferase
MNSKIFNYLQEKLQECFALPKYHGIRENITADTVVEQLPWTPVRFTKFKNTVEETFDLEIDFKGTVRDITGKIDRAYMARFFGGIWKPRTEVFEYTGEGLVLEVMKHDPKRVLDIGCGYNQFKSMLSTTVIGIDPYNKAADYMVDILDYSDDEPYDAMLSLGSVNFNGFEDVLVRLEAAARFLAPGGRWYFRANPGIQQEKAPWIELFPWSFEYAKQFATRLGLELETFKQDQGDRLYFVYYKPV